MSCSAQEKNTVGRREPVDPNSPHIIEIAIWAVNEYNKQHRTFLVFERVVKAEQERVGAGGMRYYIDLVASGNRYFAQVYDQLGTRKLESFKPVFQENEGMAVAN